MKSYDSNPAGFQVLSWSPKPQPSDPTQVHLHFEVNDQTVIVRFKGPDTLDRLIEALQQHRDEVWGPKKP